MRSSTVYEIDEARVGFLLVGEVMAIGGEGEEVLFGFSELELRDCLERRWSRAPDGPERARGLLIGSKIRDGRGRLLLTASAWEPLDDLR